MNIYRISGRKLEIVEPVFTQRAPVIPIDSGEPDNSLDDYMPMNFQIGPRHFLLGVPEPTREFAVLYNTLLELGRG